MDRKEKLEIIKSDLLCRSGEHYTDARRDGRLDWEAAVGPGESYSSRLASVRTLPDLYRVAHGHARDMITAMNCPFRVEVRLDGGGSSCTDSRTVQVATDYFDDESLTVGRKLDIFTGLAVHEACHLLYTDFGVRQANRVVRSLTNVIEDERIERRLGQTKPGLVSFLAAVKYYYFGRHEQAAGGSREDIVRLFNAVLAMVRYPSALDLGDAEEFADELLQARDALTPFPSSTAEAAAAAERIYDIMRRYEPKEEEQEPEEGNEEQNPGGQGQDSGEDPESGESGQCKGNGGAHEGAAGGCGGARMTDGEIEEALSGVLGSLERECTGSHAGESSGFVKDNRREVMAIQGDLEKGVTGDVNIYYPGGDRERYAEDLRAVRRHIAPVQAALRSNGQDRVRTVRGLRSGRLDTAKLVSARLGCESIYTARQVSRADRIALCVLIDESGSMDGDKIQAARRTAVLIREAAGGIANVELFIYGHTTDGVYARLNVYAEPGLRGDGSALGSVSAGYSNLDGTAIRECAARVRARTAERCLFIVISDGMPCEPVRKVVETVDRLSAQGFEFVNVGIEMDYDARRMYRNVILMTDMARLAPELGKVIKGQVITRTRRR